MHIPKHRDFRGQVSAYVEGVQCRAGSLTFLWGSPETQHWGVGVGENTREAVLEKENVDGKVGVHVRNSKPKLSSPEIADKASEGSKGIGLQRELVYQTVENPSPETPSAHVNQTRFYAGWWVCPKENLESRRRNRQADMYTCSALNYIG